jgi:meiotic recombination protein DMC1
MTTAAGDMLELEESEDDFCIVDIDSLQNHGINVADLKKLKAAGICTIRGLKMQTKKKLCQIKGLSEAKVDKIKEAIGKLEGGQGSAAFVTALQVTQMYFNLRKLTLLST